MNPKRPVNLITRLPTIMQQYDEMKKLTDSQNPEFDFIWEAESLMRNNLFIITAEEEGLRRYEKLLGITPSVSDSLQARRNHVLVRWNQTTPYTFRYLIGLLEVLTDGNFEIIPNFDVYEMEIIVSTMDSSILSDLAFILRNIIPANIALTSSNKVNISLNGYISFVAALRTVTEYTITQDFKAEYALSGRTGSGAAITQVKEYTLVQDFKAAITPKSITAMMGSVVNVIEYNI